MGTITITWPWLAVIAGFSGLFVGFVFGLIVSEIGARPSIDQIQGD